MFHNGRKSFYYTNKKYDIMKIIRDFKERGPLAIGTTKTSDTSNS